MGTITSISGDTLQVRTAQDFTLVTLSEATGISKPVPAAVADLRVGDQVAVRGQRDSSGSVAATTIHVVPAGVIFGGFSGGGNTAITIEFVPATPTPAP